MSNENLHKAKVAKNDEFYTQYEDVEAELSHYTQYFKDKLIYCNCDTDESNFVKYFKNNSYNVINTSDDFRLPKNIELLKEADIIVTNPPFSLFREYIALLMKYDKKFIIIGNMNSITYKEVFPLIKEKKIWLGYTSPKEFNTPNGKTKKILGLSRWFTNLDIKKRHEKLILWETYDPKKFPKYDNYDAIDIGKTNKKGKRVGDINLIPKDYYGVMGVPITFIDKYNPEQFEIIGRSGDLDWCKNECSFFTPCDSSHIASYKKMDKTWRIQNTYLIKNGKPYTVYSRIFIKRK